MSANSLLATDGHSEQLFVPDTMEFDMQSVAVMQISSGTGAVFLFPPFSFSSTVILLGSQKGEVTGQSYTSCYAKLTYGFLLASRYYIGWHTLPPCCVDTKPRGISEDKVRHRSIVEPFFHSCSSFHLCFPVFCPVIDSPLQPCIPLCTLILLCALFVHRHLRAWALPKTHILFWSFPTVHTTQKHGTWLHQPTHARHKEG